MAKRMDEAELRLIVNGELAGKTLKDLNKAASQLRSQLNNLDVKSDQFKQTAADLQKVNGQLRDMNNSLKPISTEMNKIRAESGGVGGAFTKLTGFAMAGVAGLVAGLTSMATQYLSNLTQMGNGAEAMRRKTDTVFQESAATVRAFAEQNANSLGFTRKEFVNLATSVGDLLVPMGFTREAAADLSNEIVRQGGVLSQWSGGKVQAQEATEILNKALLGERDALNSLGIDIKQSLVDQELKRQGLEDLTGESLRQAEALVTLQLVTQQSASANEAFANGANKLVEQKARLRERTEALSGMLSRFLVPIMTKLAEVVVPLIDWIGQFAVRLGNLADRMGIFNVLGAVINGLGTIVRETAETIGIFVDGLTSLFEGNFRDAYNKFAEGFKKVVYTNGVEAGKAFADGWKSKSGTGFLETGDAAADAGKKAGTDAGINFNEAFANLRATGRKDQEEADKEAAKLRKQRLDAEVAGINLNLEKELLALDFQLAQKTIKERDHADIVLSLKEQAYRDQLAALQRAGQAEEKAALDIRRKLLEIQQTRSAQVGVAPLAALPTAGLPGSITGGQQQVNQQAQVEVAALQAKFATIYQNELQHSNALAQLRVTEADRRLQLLRDRGLQETEEYKRQLNEKLAAEQAYQQTVLDNQQKALEAEQAIQEAKISTTSQGIQAAIALLSTDEKARKKHGAAIKAFEIANVGVNLAAEISSIRRAAAANPANFLIPGFGAGLAAVQIGLAVAMSAAQVARIAKTKYAWGGYTGSGSGPSDETGHVPVGVVHANEWVSPAWMTNHPVYGRYVHALEGVRRRGFAEGGYATDPVMPSLPGSSAGSAMSGAVDTIYMAAQTMMQAAAMMPRKVRADVVYTDLEEKGAELARVREDASL